MTANGMVQHLQTLVRAKYVLLAIRSKEERRVEALIRGVAQALPDPEEQRPFKVYYWSCTDGMTTLDEMGRGVEVDQSVTAPDEALRYVLEHEERAIYVLRDFHPYVTLQSHAEAPAVIRRLRDVARKLKGKKPLVARVVVLLSPVLEVPPELEADLHLVEWPLPTRVELGQILGETLKGIRDKEIRKAAQQADPERIIGAAIGLTTEQAYGAFARSLVERRTLDPKTILQEKKQIIAKTGVLEWLDPLPGGLAAVGGLDNLKAWAVNRRLGFTQEAREYGLDLPKGIFLCGVQGCGKALPLDAPVLTPMGWVKMRDLRVGDPVVAGDGSVTRVVGVYPQGALEMYWVTFQDGVAVQCSADHLWLTQTRRERRRRTPGAVRTTDEIRRTLRAGNSVNHAIPMVGPVHLPRRSVPVDPWLLGVLLGDGGLTQQVTLSTSDAWIRDEVERRLPKGLTLAGDGRVTYRVTTGKRAGRGHHVNRLLNAVRGLGLLGCRSRDKFVPPVYLWNDMPTRLAVLQGLLDTDGTVSRDGHRVSFSTTSDWLAENAEFLVRSLGGVTRRRRKQASWELDVALPPSISPFRLPRKSSRVRPRTWRAPRRFIVAVEPSEAKAAQCIAVAHPSGLYVTQDFVVTHNTYMFRALATEYGLTPVRFNVAALFGSLLGETEGKFRQAKATLKVVAPVMVLIDEIDKAMGSEGGELTGGTAGRTRGEMLTWFQEPEVENPIFKVATANNIEILSVHAPELLRKGRWDALFFVDLPNVIEREQVLQVHVERRRRGEPRPNFAAIDVKVVAQKTPGFSSAELEAVVVDAMFMAFADGRRATCTEDLVNVAGATTPLAALAKERIQGLRRWAKGRAMPASYHVPEAVLAYEAEV